MVGTIDLALVGLGFGIALAIPALRPVFHDGRVGALGTARCCGSRSSASRCAVAGVVLYWWRHTGRGTLAPALVHLATNSGGVLVA